MPVSPSLVVKLVSSSFIGLTAVGWLLVVIGFGIGSINFPQLREGPASYLYWIVSIVGPFTFIAALVHLFADKVKSCGSHRTVRRIAGAIAAFLSTFFLTGLGMILYVLGLSIQVATQQQIQLLPWVNVAFAGSVLATLFWTIVIILWHFIDNGESDE